MEEKHKIDELFEQNFRDFEVDTPEDNWIHINNRLDRKKRKARLAVWRWTGTAAAVVLAFFTGYYFNLNSPVTPNLQNSYEISKPDDIPEINKNKDILPVNPENSQNISDISTPRNLPSDNEENTVIKVSESSIFATDKLPRQNEEMNSVVGGLASDAIVSNDYNEDGNPTLTRELIPDEKANDTLRSVALMEIANRDSLEAYTTQLIIEKNREEMMKPVDNDRFSLALKAGPAVSFKSIELADNNPLANQNIENEVVNNSYTAGMEFAYNSNESWEFSAGLYYSYYRQTNPGLLLEFSNSFTSGNPAPSNTNQGLGVTSGAEVSIDLSTTDGSNIKINNSSSISGNPNNPSFVLIPDLEQTYEFIDVPFKVGYRITKGKLILKAQSGFNTRFLTQSQLNFVDDDGNKQYFGEGNISSFSLQLLVGPGLDWRVTRNFNLQIDPLLYYSVTPFDQSQELDSFWHQFMIFSGFSYRF